MMTEIASPYTVTPTGPRAAAIVQAAPAPLDPRTRLALIGLRRVALLLADVLGEWAGLPKRGGAVE